MRYSYPGPERPVEPPELAVVLECDLCGETIFEGDKYFDIPNVGCFCENCVGGWESFAELPEPREALKRYEGGRKQT